MRTEEAIREKLAFLEEQLSIGQDFEGSREIARLRWILELGPDLIHVPRPTKAISLPQMG